MQIRIPLPIVAAATIAILLTGCTAASKKAHLAERAEKFFKAGEYDKAKIEYLNLIKIDPSDANAYARSEPCGPKRARHCVRVRF